MSKVKESPPALVDVRSQYEAALKESLQAAQMLAIAVDTAIKLKQVSDAMTGDLKERVAVFNRAYFGDHDA